MRSRRSWRGARRPRAALRARPAAPGRGRSPSRLAPRGRTRMARRACGRNGPERAPARASGPVLRARLSGRDRPRPAVPRGSTGSLACGRLGRSRLVRTPLRAPARRPEELARRSPSASSLPNGRWVRQSAGAGMSRHLGSTDSTKRERLRLRRIARRREQQECQPRGNGAASSPQDQVKGDSP
jgi:hypothetical protein